MELTEGQFLQYLSALGLGAVFLAAAFALREKKIMWILLVFIPFQPISSRWGNINMFLVLAVAAVYLMRGRVRWKPLAMPMAFIMLAYMLSMTQVRPGTAIDHLLFIVAVVSNFALFWLTYNFVRREGNWQTIFKIFGVLNALILAYCALQVSVGLDRFTFLGSTELSFNAAQDAGVTVAGRRLTGPFGGTATIAEYLAFQVMIWGYFLIYARGKSLRTLVSIVVALNLAFLIATGNRGGIVTLAVGALGFLYLFKSELGPRRFVTVSVSAAVLFLAMSFVVVTYSEFGTVFERFSGTTLERGFIPDSRAGWVNIWDQVIEKPIFGHGPRMGIMGAQEMTYPHNLFMFLFFTVGAVGFLAYAYFFWCVWINLFRARRFKIRDKFLSGTPSLGLLILIMFIVSEMRIEFMRFVWHDYQQYFFMLMGGFLAWADMVRAEARQSRSLNKKSARRRQPLVGTAIPTQP
jgi:O-antigen ligase